MSIKLFTTNQFIKIVLIHQQLLARLWSKFSIKYTLILLTLFFSMHTFAAIDKYVFETAQQEQDFLSLTNELRCPKCQNQNLEGSNSVIAQDLKNQIYKMVVANKSQNDIKDYMLARYGDYITYDTPIKPVTYILWFLPIIIFFMAIFLWYARLQGQISKQAVTFPIANLETNTPYTHNSDSEANHTSKSVIAFNPTGFIKYLLILTVILASLSVYFVYDDRYQFWSTWYQKHQKQNEVETWLSNQKTSDIQPPPWAMQDKQSAQLFINILQHQVHKHSHNPNYWYKLSTTYLYYDLDIAALESIKHAVQLEPLNGKYVTEYAKMSLKLNNLVLTPQIRKALNFYINNGSAVSEKITASMLLITGEAKAGEYLEALNGVEKLSNFINKQSGNYQQAINSLAILKTTITEQYQAQSNLNVELNIDDKIINNITPPYTIFVYIQDINGKLPPYAIKKFIKEDTSTSLTIHFSKDDFDVFNKATNTINTTKESAVIKALISLSNQPTPTSGDYIATPVVLSSLNPNIDLTIDKLVP